MQKIIKGATTNKAKFFKFLPEYLTKISENTKIKNENIKINIRDLFLLEVKIINEHTKHKSGI